MNRLYFASVISSCSTSSPGYHAASGLCFGLLDDVLRNYYEAKRKCSLATINNQSKWDFIKSAASDHLPGDIRVSDSLLLIQASPGQYSIS